MLVCPTNQLNEQERQLFDFAPVPWIFRKGKEPVHFCIWLTNPEQSNAPHSNLARPKRGSPFYRLSRNVYHAGVPRSTSTITFSIVVVNVHPQPPKRIHSALGGKKLCTQCEDSKKNAMLGSIHSESDDVLKSGDMCFAVRVFRGWPRPRTSARKPTIVRLRVPANLQL